MSMASHTLAVSNWGSRFGRASTGRSAVEGWSTGGIRVKLTYADGLCEEPYAAAKNKTRS
jgi:hypothetical protein